MKHKEEDLNREIFPGYSFRKILDMQQGKHVPEILSKISGEEQAKQIMADVAKFKIPVYKEVVDNLGLKLPEGYVLEDEKYIFKK